MIDKNFGWARTAIAILGLTVASVPQAQDDDAEIPDINPSLEIGRWQMFSPRGSGVVPVTFLYDTATGRVWRFFTGCGDDPGDGDGCLVELPSYPETDDRAALALDAIVRALEGAGEAVQEPMEEASEAVQEQDPDGENDTE